jgi:hypothetical protein
MDNVNALMQDYTPVQRVKALVATPFVFMAMYGQMVCAGVNFLFGGIASAIGNWIQK